MHWCVGNTILHGGYKQISLNKRKGEEYNVLGGRADYNGDDGLSHFYSNVEIGFNDNDSGFLGYASEKIAQHFGKYFGMLIIEAKCGDIVDFKIIK